MSELKVYHCNEWHNEYTEFYLKSEADKVIADLEESHKMEVEQLLMEIVKLKADYKEACGRLQTANLIKDEQLAATRHSNHKRCLAMARLCGKTVDHLNSEGYIYEKENHTKELTDCIRGTEFYDKWYHRWLALTEEPTWTKFLQLIHNEASK